MPPSLPFFLNFTLQYCIGFAIHQHESTTGVHMFPILNAPSPYHLSGSSQCTSPKHPVSCIEPRLVIRFLYNIIHVSMPFSQIIPPLPFPQSPKDCSIHLGLFCYLAYRVFLALCVMCSVVSDSLQAHGLQPTSLLCPRSSPGNNTEVGAISYYRVLPDLELNLGLLSLLHFWLQ